MKVAPRILGLVLAVAGLLAACASAPTKVALDAPQQDVGYSLLAKLLHDEKRLKQIFLLKEAPQPTRQLIEEISGYSETAGQKLAALAKQAPAIRLDVDGLPAVENQTRLTLEALSTEELLEAEGKVFESAVLLSQSEALNYGIGLSQVLAQGETNPARRKFLEDVGKTYAGLRARVVDRIMKL